MQVIFLFNIFILDFQRFRIYFKNKCKIYLQLSKIPLPSYRNKAINQLKINNMTAQDLKKGSIVEIRLNLSIEQMNQPVQVEIDRCSEKYLWFKNNQLQRMGRSTFDTFIKHFGYKIISL
jgi:hypothetical protein